MENLDLIKYLMDFNMDAEVTLNVTGVPENFDISWSGKDDNTIKFTAEQLEVLNKQYAEYKQQQLSNRFL